MLARPDLKLYAIRRRRDGSLLAYRYAPTARLAAEAFRSFRRAWGLPRVAVIAR